MPPENSDLQILAEWEREAISVLGPLLDAGVKLYYPFFANTLPLAFHYWQATRSAKGNDPTIRLVEWGRQKQLIETALRRSEHERSGIVCYASRSDFDDLNKCRSSEVTLDSVTLNTYQPLSIFTEMNLGVLEACQKLREGDERIGESRLVDFHAVRTLLEEKFECFELFSDIRDQAQKLLVHNGESEWQLVDRDDPTSLFDCKHVKSTSLRVFFCGGPLTTYYRSKPERFIEFSIEPDGDATAAFQTVMIICGNELQQVSDALAKYHRAMTTAAASEVSAQKESCESGVWVSPGFRSVQYRYNRLARLLAHRSFFDSSYAYARCVAEHEGIQGD